jgi:CxxC motif-containing protein (DUF1111 family)
MFAPSSSGRRLAGGAAFLVALGGILVAASASFADDEPEPVRVRRTKQTAQQQLAQPALPAAQGREIFERRWSPGEQSRHGGDGLGPVYNEISCAACHHQGGVGGGGAAAKNVDMIVPMLAADSSFTASGLKASDAAAWDRAQARRKDSREKLARLFPSLVGKPSAVMHRFGPGREFDAWKRELLNQRGSRQAGDEPRDLVDQRAKDVDRRIAGFAPIIKAPPGGPLPLGEVIPHSTLFLVRSQRNTPALFGEGLIDGIPDHVLHNAARKTHSRFPEVSGRVARLADRSTGRFGWKAQMATLHEFVLTACAVELGLHVPGASQAAVPMNPAYSPPGWDLDEAECLALVSFVRDLPAPKQELPANVKAAATIRQGQAHFESVGCATCHTASLGTVSGIFSDLLLHDMGPVSAALGAYYGGSSSTLVDVKPALPGDDTASGEAALPVLDTSRRAASKPEQIATTTPQQLAKLVGALPSEWRTPPLWGVADSAPYMHDGRAATLEEAIAAHGGEAARPVKLYRGLSPANRGKLIAFLKSLKAPEADE